MELWYSVFKKINSYQICQTIFRSEKHSSSAQRDLNSQSLMWICKSQLFWFEFVTFMLCVRMNKISVSYRSNIFDGFDFSLATYTFFWRLHNVQYSIWIFAISHPLFSSFFFSYYSWLIFALWYFFAQSFCFCAWSYFCPLSSFIVVYLF